MPTLSKIQKKMIKEKCPACKFGDLHEVEGMEGDTGEILENYLWCNNCYCSVDSSGGYTN